ncbi:hypothetical protein A2U01_0050843, partial [Trifolium medium]|nr:hypothetical protein [Trifolium medium]
NTESANTILCQIQKLVEYPLVPREWTGISLCFLPPLP